MCQLTNISECDFTSKNFSSTSKAMMKPMLYFIDTDGQTFGSSASDVFQKFGEKLIITNVAEQRINQPLHMHNKYRNRPDMNKTGGNAI